VSSFPFKYLKWLIFFELRGEIDEEWILKAEQEEHLGTVAKLV